MSEYISRLASRNDDLIVIANEDIINDQGALIAKNGTKFDKTLYDKISHFKLLKPLEDSIFIENQLTAKAIYDQIIHLVENDPSLTFINTTFGRPKVLMMCCLQVEKFPILQQKLTVLDMELTDVFRQSLMSAFLAYIFALHAELTSPKILSYFLAGLSHDVGLLHIDRYILTKKEELTPQEWKKVQSHPIISYEILKRLNNFPMDSATATLEHHENLDGSGYPRGKRANDIGELGQILSLLDSIIAIYLKNLKPFNHNLKDVLPLIQINRHNYNKQSISILFKILHDMPPHCMQKADYDILSDLIDHVEGLQVYTNTIIKQLKRCNENLGFRHNQKDLYGIQNITINLLLILHSTGLEDAYQHDWRSQLSGSDTEKQSLYQEIEENRLVQQEIIYLIKHYQKSASAYISRYSDTEEASIIQQALAIFDKTPYPPQPPKLKEYWETIKSG